MDVRVNSAFFNWDGLTLNAFFVIVMDKIATGGTMPMKLKRNILPKYIGIVRPVLTCLIFTVPCLMLRAAVLYAAPSDAFTAEI